MGNVRAQLTRDVKLMQDTIKNFDIMDKLAAKLIPLVHVPANQQQRQRIQELSASYKKLMEEFITAFNSNQEFDEKRRELANSVLNGCNAVAKKGRHDPDPEPVQGQHQRVQILGVGDGHRPAGGPGPGRDHRLGHH